MRRIFAALVLATGATLAALVGLAATASAAPVPVSHQHAHVCSHHRSGPCDDKGQGKNWGHGKGHGKPWKHDKGHGHDKGHHGKKHHGKDKGHHGFDFLGTLFGWF